jgi:hypothetical protein
MLRHLLDAGADMVGTTTGAVAGFFTMGPVSAGFGAAAGVALSHSLRRVGEEVSQRYLAPRESKRIGSLLLITQEKIRAKLEAGFPPREGGFFDDDGLNRSASDEIFEGILLAAQREHQERKIPHLASMLCNIDLDRTISKDEANFLLRTAEALSYLQFCILGIAARQSEPPFADLIRLRSEDLEKIAPISGSNYNYNLANENNELFRLGLLDDHGPTGVSGAWTRKADLVHQTLTYSGERLVSFLELRSIADSVLQAVLPSSFAHEVEQHFRRMEGR